LKPLTAKLNEVSKGSFPSLATRQAEITKLQQEMEAAAQVGEFEKASQLLKDLTSKVDAYLADKAKAQKYQDTLQATQTAVNGLTSHAQKDKFTTEIAAITAKLRDAQTKGDGGDWENAVKQLQQLQSEISKTKTSMDMVAKGLDRARADQVADV